MATRVLKGLESLPKQIHFAAIRALNDSAFAVREDINESIANEFTLRNKWTLRGTRVEKASKNRPVAKVGSIREYLEDHVSGDVREGKNAIPIKVRRRKTTLIRKRRWPGALRDEPQLLFRRVGSVRGLFRFRGRGRARRAEAVWIIPDRQKVDKSWNFEMIARRSHQRHFTEKFPAAFKHALKTAHTRGRRKPKK